MHSLLLLPFVLPVLAAAQSTLPYVRTVLVANGTFLENIHATADGMLLITSLSTPTLFMVNPNATTPQLTALFTVNDTNVNCLTGIDEYDPGKYAFNALNLTAATFTSYHASVWKFELPATSPYGTITPHKVVDLPTSEIVLANALTARLVGHPDTVFISNSAGSVRSVNLTSGANQNVIVAPELAPGTGVVPLGVNGLHVRGLYFYYVNSGQRIAGRVPIRVNGTATGPFEVLATTPTGQRAYDDFALDLHDRMWIASHPNSLEVVFQENGTWRQVVVDTGLPATALGPTSTAFGRGSKEERETLYMTTADGILLAFNTTMISLA